MCVVSFVSDWGRTHWPWNPITPTVPVPNTVDNWTITTLGPEVEKSALEAFERLMQAAKDLDVILGLPDCEDPSKAAWLNEVRERVRQHELSKINQRLAR